jgi:hypothetical protein
MALYSVEPLRKSALAVVLVASLSVLSASAQIQNPIKAAKDAYNKAKQQQQQEKQQQQGQQQNQQPQPQQQSRQPDQSQTAAAQPVTSTKAPAAQPASASPDAGADCCSPEAMKKVAASIGFVDIVGIKLGMTPEQAVAAVKAYNPNLKIENLTSRLEHPSGPLGNFVRVPHMINAYTANTRQDLGPVEWIAMQFTLPPGPPLLAKVQRYTGFLASQPVLASNLIESLRKKYGQANSQGNMWVYDSNGKLLTRVGNPQEGCAHDGMATGVAGGGSGPHPPPGETGVGVNLNNTSNSQLYFLPEAGPDCVPLVWVAARGLAEDVAPNSQQSSLTVTMESGALMNMSLKATHAWLQAEADAKIKQDNDAAAARSAPKL